MGSITDDVVLLVEALLHIDKAELVEVEGDAHPREGLQPVPCAAVGRTAVDAANNECASIAQLLHGLLGQRGPRLGRVQINKVEAFALGQSGGGGLRCGPFARLAAAPDVGHWGCEALLYDDMAAPRMGVVAQAEEQAQVAQRHAVVAAAAHRMGRQERGVGIVDAALIHHARRLGPGKRRMDAVAATVAEAQQANDGPPYLIIYIGVRNHVEVGWGGGGGLGFAPEAGAKPFALSCKGNYSSWDRQGTSCLFSAASIASSCCKVVTK